MAKASGTRARYYSIASMPPRIAAPLHSSLSSNFVQNNDRHGYHVGSVWLERLTLSADARTVCKGVDPNLITRTIQVLVHVYFVSAITLINRLASMTRSLSELELEAENRLERSFDNTGLFLRHLSILLIFPRREMQVGSLES